MISRGQLAYNAEETCRLLPVSKIILASDDELHILRCSAVSQYFLRFFALTEFDSKSMQIPYLFIPKNLDFSFPYLQGIPHLAITASW